MRAPILRHAAIVSLALTLPGAGPAGGRAPALPALVFVSRRPPPDSLAGAVPGLGPRDLALVTGGRLLLRERDGRVREILPKGALADVSHPAVSPDGRRVAFAGVAGPEEPWRLYLAPLAGGAPEPLHAAAGARAARYDDLSPCWLDARHLCFASTRDGAVTQVGGARVANLYVLDLAGGQVARLTAERNGAATPSRDPRGGGVLYSRWWHNRWRASADGVTAAGGALAGDDPSLWQAMEIGTDGRGARVACGFPPARAASSCYAPVALADGSIVGVYGRNASLWPTGGGVGLARFLPRHARARILRGPIVEEGARDGYASPSGLAAPSACSPAPLGDGRLVFAYDAGGRGDFGLWVMDTRDGSIARVLDLPGTLELDPAPVAPWRAPPLRAMPATPESEPPLLAADAETLARRPARFRFVNRDVFAAAPAGAGYPTPPARVAGARLRFYALIAGSGGAGGDSAVLLREAPVSPGGAVDVAGLPASVPLFEQLVDAAGRVLLTGHGPAHVAGANSGAPGETVRCIGCHLGHSLRGR